MTTDVPQTGAINRLLFSVAGFPRRFFVPFMYGMKISGAENKRGWKRRRRWIRPGGRYYYSGYCSQRSVEKE